MKIDLDDSFGLAQWRALHPNRINHLAFALNLTLVLTARRCEMALQLPKEASAGGLR